MRDETTFSIILAAGRGRRMRSAGTHKVCFEVASVPVILRALQTYHECGVDHHIVVVGQMAEQIMETVGGRVPNVSFAHQPAPFGTGHAAKCGARILENAGYQGLVLVVAGDKVLQPGPVQELIRCFHDNDADLAFMVGPKDDYATSGRVLCDDDGAPVAIVETSEIRLSELLAELEADAHGWEDSIPAATILERIRARFPDEKKARIACNGLYELAAAGETVRRGELLRALEPLRARTTVTTWQNGKVKTIPASAAEHMTTEANLSVYLFRADALYRSLRSLARDNAQGEEFLTDTIKYLASVRTENGVAVHRIVTVSVRRPGDVLAYNTPEELRAIEKQVQHRIRLTRQHRGASQHGADFRPVTEWRRVFESSGERVTGFLSRVYGNEPQAHEAKRRGYLAALQCYEKHHGAADKVLIVRSPGRLNLVGRHIDHRGGDTNAVAIHQEVILVASLRDDDQVHLHNTNPETFRHSAFSIEKEISSLDWSDWLTCVNSPKTLAMAANGDWSNYVKAAALRLRERFRGAELRGLNIVASSIIPTGSGLGASSAMIVAAAEALVAANGLTVRPQTLVDLCGEGEWFTGGPQDMSDHEAIKFAKRGIVHKVGAFPFEIKDSAPFFPDHSIVLCRDAAVAARTPADERPSFGRRILGYVTGEIVLKQLFPAFARSIHHLRDINCANLGISLGELYHMLMRLPVRITPAELLDKYGPFWPEHNVKLKDLLASMPPDMPAYEVRGPVLYGLAECERSARCINYLRQGNAAALGELWLLSHDGDRLAAHDERMRSKRCNGRVSNSYLKGLVADLRSEDPARVARAQIWRQPGRYGASTPQIDRVVDLAKALPGVKGAQMAGAGLAGHVMILVENRERDAVMSELAALELEAEVVHAVEGAGLVEI